MKFKIDYKTSWGEHVAIRTNLQKETIPLCCEEDGHTWSQDIDLPPGTMYRYCIMKESDIVRMEEMCLPHRIELEANARTEITDSWRDPWRIAGISIPVFSLRTSGSQGVGDFGDLHTLIDWVDQMGMRAIQILPINDTTINGTYQDSYPYNSISAFALHPMYLDLRLLGVDDISLKKTFSHLNALPQVDYEQVNIAKRRFIVDAYLKNGKLVLNSPEFKAWKEINNFWLKPYAQFRANQNIYTFETLSTKSETINLFYYTQYQLHTQLLAASNYAFKKGIILKGDIPIGVSRDGVEVTSHPELFNIDQSTGAPPDFFSQDGQNWGFPTYNWNEMSKDGYQWWQKRMQNMSRYFTAYRIDHILGFFRIWAIPLHKIHGRSPKYRELKIVNNVVSGLEGQFQPALPLRRQEIESMGLCVSDEQFDDLFVEDFYIENTFHPRITAQNSQNFNTLSESQKEAFNRIHFDFFFQRHNQYWYDEAMKKLPALTRSNIMICCGEDLGMVPPCVPSVMNQLSILSLEIQNMPKFLGVDFSEPSWYPQKSVCTLSSHDTPTIRGWWEEDHERAQRLYNNVLHMHGKAPQELSGWICEQIICDQLSSPSSLCILTFQDWIGISESLRYKDAHSERINEPSNPRHYWRYRMHLNIEDLMKECEYNSHIREMITAFGRETKLNSTPHTTKE